MEPAQAKPQSKLGPIHIMNYHHEVTNGSALHRVDKSGSSRKERRKDWWGKNKKIKTKVVLCEDNGVKEEEEESVPVKTKDKGHIEENNVEHEDQRPKLRNRETIAKPEVLKYEPNFSRGFHTKIMQNLYSDTYKKKKNKPNSDLSESLPKFNKRKPTTPPANSLSENAKKFKDSVEPMEEFDSYQFSLKLINGEVDVSKNAAGKDSKNKYVLFIGNLPYDITKEQLEEHFRKTGGIKSIRIPKEKGTDSGRGFAYMEFDGRISHGIALRLHQTTLGGRKINVEFTSIGGGKSVVRKEKLQLKNKKRKNMKMQ